MSSVRSVVQHFKVARRQAKATRAIGHGRKRGITGDRHRGRPLITGRKLAMVGADTCCVMVMPASMVNVGNVHHELLLNGTTILENMNLLELARDQVYEFMDAGQTLRIKGATGPPLRPIGIR